MFGWRTVFGSCSTGSAALAVSLLVLAACGTATAEAPIEAELAGTWRLLAVCWYDTDAGDPCEEPTGVRTVSFDIQTKEVSWSDQTRQGRYRLEVQPTADGGELVYIDLPGPGAAAQLWLEADTLVLSWAYVDGAEERYIRGRGVVELTPPAPSLEANLLGDDPRRTALVYLPPSHSDRDAGPFPVVYLLHAFGAGPESWRGGATGYEGMDIAATLDSLVAAGAVAEMIVVMPDARTLYGGSWYGSSPAIGDWERYVAIDLVDAVDDSFRTLARREARALVGQSMGAYGALRIASAHPEVFGTAVAVSAPNLVNPNPLGLAAMEAALAVPSPDAVLAGSPLPAVIWSKAAAFSPDARSPPFFATLPVAPDGDTLALRSAIWGAWERNTVRGLLADSARRRALGTLHLRLDVGTRDPLREESVSLADTLRALGVEAPLVEFDGGHVEGVRAHFTRSLFPWLSSRLAIGG